MIDKEQLGAPFDYAQDEPFDQAQDKLFEGLRAAITVADENGRIIFLNDLAVEHYSDRGGEKLLGTDIRDCHNPQSRAKIKALYARYRAGDLTPTRYHEEEGNGLAKSIVLIPILVDGGFRGVAELIWDERPELVFEL